MIGTISAFWTLKCNEIENFNERKSRKRRINDGNSADETAMRMRPFDMSFSVDLIPYGELVEKCNALIGKTALNNLYCSVVVPPKTTSVQKPPESHGCKIQLPKLC